MVFNTGEILHNRYRIVKLIAQGGFGTLYRSWDMSLERACVLKENLSNDPDSQRQFLREAKILASLNHRNLPRVTDYFIANLGEQILVMDYVEGQDLGQLLEDRGSPLPEDKGVKWGMQICDALIYLHSQKPPIIHRDIKPSNIRITPGENAVLIDFGIAKVFDPQVKTTIGAQAISPGYSPYEQYGKGKTDQRTDIYALGATLYAILTGQEPPESIQRVVKDPLVAPRMLNSNLSLRTSAAIVRAMQIDPTLRFQNAADFKVALTAPPPVKVAQKPASPQVIPSQLSQNVGAKGSKPWMWLSVVIALLLVIAGLLAWILGSGTEQRNAFIPQEPSEHSNILGLNQETNFPLRETAGFETPNNESVLPTLTPLVYLVRTGDTCSEIAEAYGVAIHEIVEANEGLLPDCGVLFADQPLIIPQLRGPIDTPEWIRSPTLQMAVITQVSSIDRMELVYIPEGEFTMGAAEDDPDAVSIEMPSHEVYLNAFWIDRTEITNRMYRLCAEQGGCEQPVQVNSKSREDYFSNPLYADYPVVNVRWEDADSYCRWAGRRLPTEAEWEKAARGDDLRIFPWGLDPPNLRYANFNNLIGDTDEIGSYPSGQSPYGIFDMAGNVAEWVADWYDSEYYRNSEYDDPTGPLQGEFRLIRGGSWFNPGTAIRTTFRLWNYPEISSEIIGFRCAK